MLLCVDMCGCVVVSADINSFDTVDSSLTGVIIPSHTHPPPSPPPQKELWMHIVDGIESSLHCLCTEISYLQPGHIVDVRQKAASLNNKTGANPLPLQLQSFLSWA